MSVTRALFAAVAVVALLSPLWYPSAQVALREQPQGTPVAGELPPFKPVARVSSLMAGLNNAFGELREALPPSDDENRLHRIGTWSDVIAELSNVNGRHRRKQAYLDMAGETRTIAQQLAVTARADMPDEHGIRELFAQLDTSCQTCHEADD